MKKTRLAAVCCVAVALLLLPGPGGAETLIVTTDFDEDCSDGICDLQSALNRAATNREDDTIRIGPGTYVATSTFLYESSENHSLTIDGYGDAYGPYHPVLTGSGQTGVLCLYAWEAPNAHITVKDLEIRDGYSDPLDRGGLEVGISNGDVAIEHCHFYSNKAFRGGGLYVSLGDFGTGTVHISSCTFDNNEATDGGGAFVSFFEFGTWSIDIRNCTFHNNRAAYDGAGLYVHASEVTLEGNTFGSLLSGSQNALTGAGRGGGAYVYTNQGPTIIRDNRFWKNLGGADCKGGALYLSGAGIWGITLEGNTFLMNELGNGSSGAGAYIQSADGPLNLSSNTFTQNRVGASAEAPLTGGGGLYAGLWGSMAECKAVNNVFLHNRAGSGASAFFTSEMGAINLINNTSIIQDDTGHGIFMNVAVANLYNNILWGSPLSPWVFDLTIQGYNDWNAVVNAYYNDIGSTWYGETVDFREDYNKGEDPELVDPANGDCHLKASSPCIDTGDNNAPGIPAVDMDGQNRIIDGGKHGAVVDMGAYEYPGIEIIARAGPDQSVEEGDTVFLNGSNSQGSHLSFSWEQTGGPEIVLSDHASARPTFVAPPVSPTGTTLAFRLTVMDDNENLASDEVQVTVRDNGITVFPAGVISTRTPTGDPIGIAVGSGSSLTRFIVTETAVYVTGTVTSSPITVLQTPYGLIDLQINSQTVISGTLVYTPSVTVHLPGPAPEGYGWALFNPALGWIDFTANVDFGPTRVTGTVTYEDNASYDLNATPGIFWDPSGLALIVGPFELSDAIAVLQILAGITDPPAGDNGVDINLDGKIGLEEAIHVLQKVSSIR